MFCAKCGKTINDEAVICPYCGCATGNFNLHTEQSKSSSMYSSDYPAIKKFADQAATVRTMGIFAAVLMLGIGIIFSIIIWVNTKSIVIPEITTKNANEIAEFEEAKRKLDIGRRLSGLPLIGLSIILFVAVIIAPIMAIAS